MATSACETSFPFSPSVWSLPMGKYLAFQSRFCNAIQWERRDIYSDTAGTFWLLIHVKEKAMHLFVRVCIFECVYQACMHANTRAWVICLLLFSWLKYLYQFITQTAIAERRKAFPLFPKNPVLLFNLCMLYFPPKQTKTNWHVCDCHTPKTVMQIRFNTAFVKFTYC